MLRFAKWLPLTGGLILLTLSVHAEDIVEHQVLDPSEAIDYWTKEKMQSATPMPFPTLPIDENQASSEMHESGTEGHDSLTPNEGGQEQLPEEEQPRKGYQPRAKPKH